MKTLSHVANRFVNCPLMIHPPKLDVMMRAIGPRLGVDLNAALSQQVPMDATATLMAKYSEAGDSGDYSLVDGIAVIPVQGTLIKKDTWMSAWSGCTSYEQIQKQMASALSDNSVRAIMLDIDSPGGETSGCFDLADFIYSARNSKPIYAAANDIALSAAYAIASSASKVFVTRTGAVGSIGVYALHVDQSEFDKQAGAKFSYVFAGTKKVDGNPHAPLSESASADIQAEVDREYGIFTETVARNRKANVKKIVGTQAGLLWADNALPLLADEVGTFDEAMNALREAFGAQVRSSTAAVAAIQPKGDDMAKETVSTAAAADDCDEMKGKTSAPATEDDKKQPAEPDGDEEAKGKKGAATFTPILGALVASRSEDDIKAITALCKMAGHPEKLGEFLTTKKSTGQYFSVADVSEALTSARVEESEKSMINSNVDPNKGAAGSLQSLESEATAYVRQNVGQVTNGLYVAGSVKVTKERAYAQALEANPEGYEAFRKRHNAGALIAQLEAAGVSFQK